MWKHGGLRQKWGETQVGSETQVGLRHKWVGDTRGV